MKKIVLLTLLISAISFAQKPIFTTAKVKAVTVYFNAAELSQTTTLMLPKGTSEIVVKNIADNLNENTIQIAAPATVTVLSSEFSDNYIAEYQIDENNPAIKRVRDSIEIIKKQLKKVQIDEVSCSKTIELLDKNQIIAGANTGLNVVELMKLAEYYRTKRTELNNSFNAFQEKEEKLKTTLNNLTNQLEVNTQKQEKASKGKLILQVMNEVAGSVTFDINYITNTASWIPFYDLRAESIKEPINMMYKAQVSQRTGIDWNKVKLTLSSGNPNQNNQAPNLNSWFLRYQPTYQQPTTMYERKGKELNDVVITAQSIKRPKKSMGYAVSTINAVDIENQLNVSFDIPIPYDIASNGKAHSVSLKEIKLPATFNYFAAPRADKDAFLMAKINDYSKYNLLQGEANIIFEGLYVGKTMINPNQTADTLSLSMGRDKKISIQREKIADKSGTKFLSSYKEQTFTFDITVRNNKKEAVQIFLNDQIPLSTDKEITITVIEDSKAKTNTDTGILTWDLNLAPNETKKLRLSYKVKYPKDKIIENL